MKYVLSLIITLAIVGLFGAFATAPAFANHLPEYVGVAAASMDVGELPPCPSMFRCRVR